MKWLKPTVLLVLLITISSTAQIKPIDNNTASITKDEIKFLTQLFIDYQTLEDIHAKDVEKIFVYERVIYDKDDLIKLKDQTIDLLKRRLEIVTPAWYNKFYIGFAVGVITTVIVAFLVR